MGSLRLRLLLGAALWVALALLTAGCAIGWLYIQSVERTLRVELSAGTLRLAAVLDPEAPSQDALAKALPDPRYGTPAGGLYWQVEDLASGTRLRSRSLWDATLALGNAVGGEQFSVLPGPGGGALSVVSRTVRFPAAGGEHAFRIAVAQDRALLDASIGRFWRELALALGALGLSLVLAAGAQVTLGLRPLGRLRTAIEAVRTGTERRVAPEFPVEIMPLVAEVNELLGSQERSMEFARARAADLAHGLKTPLAVLSSVAAALRGRGEEADADIVDGLVGEMADRIDYQLRLARLRQRTRMHMFNASLNEALRRTLGVVRKTRRGEELEWHIAVQDRLELDIDRNDLVELAGVILENAVQWAASAVRVEAGRQGAQVVLTVTDDGPGLSAAEIGRLGSTRGVRLDRQGAVQGGSSGYGIAIAREIVELNNGRIEFAASDAGGLRVVVSLPSAAHMPVVVQPENGAAELSGSIRTAR